MLGGKSFLPSCAEGYRTFKLDYKLEGVRVVHITQFLYERGLRIPPQPDTAKKIRVAFQDPCRSGRQMPIDPVYEEPRELVKRVDNAELVELKTFRADAQCCGVAQMMYCNDKTKGLTAKRMDEATDVDADYLLVACPKCLTHFGCLHHENKWKHVEERYGFQVRTQEYIRGRGTLAVVDEEICMGCTHCFDNCAFESIGMVDRKFALPEYSYTSRKAIIIEENCVGCEKCAIVCPVDAITMVTKHGFEVKDGRVVSTTPPAPPAPRPLAVAPAAAKPTAPVPASAPKPVAPILETKAAAPPPVAEASAPKPPPLKPEPKIEEESGEPPEEPSDEEETHEGDEA